MSITRNRLSCFNGIATDINEITLFHGKLGGYLDLREGYLYLYSNPENSSIFAEHVFYNEKGFSLKTEAEYALGYLESRPFIQKIKAKVKNTALIDFEFFRKAATDVALENLDLLDLFDKFEESEYRTEFLDLLKAKGFDSAVILNDMSPEEAGGDWGFKESFVLFYPEKQIILQ